MSAADFFFCCYSPWKSKVLVVGRIYAHFMHAGRNIKVLPSVEKAYFIKAIFFKVVNDLVCQLTVTPLCAHLVLQRLFAKFY
jgi:hypothetical protein